MSDRRPGQTRCDECGGRTRQTRDIFLRELVCDVCLSRRPAEGPADPRLVRHLVAIQDSADAFIAAFVGATERLRRDPPVRAMTEAERAQPPRALLLHSNIKSSGTIEVSAAGHKVRHFDDP